MSAALPALGDEAPQELPKDGWWVRYFVTEKYAQTNEERTVKQAYSLVGTATEDGSVCRWVEIKSDRTVNGKEQHDILKFLVPEKDLLESEKPLDGLVRAYRRFDGGEVETMKFNQPLGSPGFVSSADFVWGILFVAFPGPQRKSMLIAEEKVVDYQRGRLNVVEGRSGTRVATRLALTNGEKQTQNLHFTVWNHPDVSPAFAASKSRLEYLRDDKPRSSMTSEWTVEDFGSDAKSALPEHN
jgi:hypothetical protein